MTHLLRDHCANRHVTKQKAVFRKVAGLLFMAGLSLTGARAAHASPIGYQIFNHPDGAQSSLSADADGYVLRLDLSDLNQVNTFNANHSSVVFSWDPMTDPTSATLTGQVTHNESGINVHAYDTHDDVYQLTATLSGLSFTDQQSEPTTWFDGHANNQTFNDMLGSLRQDANSPNRAVERSKTFSDDVARIYWNVTDISLTPVNIQGEGQTYTGPNTWEQFGPPMLMQYRWRLWKSQFPDPQYDLLGVSGWVQPVEGQGQLGTNDFLFVLNASPIPEPASLSLLVLGSIVLLGGRRRKRKTMGTKRKQMAA